MKIHIGWEKTDWIVESDEKFITPLELLEQLGESGRTALIETLILNYRWPLVKQFEEIQRFEDENF